MSDMREGDQGASDQYKVFPLPVSVRASEVKILQVESTYDREEMLTPDRAVGVVRRLREEMVRQIAEKLYDHMEFQDYENFETMRIHMRGRIQIIRRKD